MQNWFQNLVDWEGLENPVSCHHGLVLLVIDHWKLLTLVKIRVKLLLDGWMHLQFYQQLSVLELLIFQIRNYFLTQVKKSFFCECKHKEKTLIFCKATIFLGEFGSVSVSDQLYLYLYLYSYLYPAFLLQRPLPHRVFLQSADELHARLLSIDCHWLSNICQHWLSNNIVDCQTTI